MAPAVEVNDLVVERGRRLVLHGIHARIPSGHITGLLGPSGSGKTTLLRAIMGVQVVKSGTVWWGTLRLAGATLGHVQALRVAWEWLTASGTLHLGAKRAQGYGLAKAEADWSQLPELEPDWVGQLHEHRDTVMSLLAAAAGNK